MDLPNEKMDLAIKSYLKMYEEKGVLEYQKLYNSVKESGQNMDKVTMITPEIAMASSNVKALLDRVRTTLKLHFKIDDSDVLKYYTGVFMKEIESIVVG